MSNKLNDHPSKKVRVDFKEIKSKQYLVTIDYFSNFWRHGPSLGKISKKQVSPKLMPKLKGPYMIVKCFGTVYDIMTSFKVTKLHHFDLLKPCNATSDPRWIVRARTIFVWGQHKLEDSKLDRGQVQTGSSQSLQSTNQ